MAEGVKYDQNKLRMDLLPVDSLRAVAGILTFGAKKYGDRNWEKGMAWSRLYGALMRHITSWWMRKEYDEESGASHLWHASCCILMLVAFQIRGIGQDDRP